MLLSALGFALMGALVKTAGQAEIPVLQIIFVRAIISVLLSLAEIRRAGAHPLGKNRWLLFARGTVGFISLTCVFYAVLHLPYAQATVLQYLHPVFTAALAWLFLGEIATRATLTCVALSMLGLLVMLAPSLSVDSLSTDWLAVSLGLCGAFGSAVAYTIVRKLAATEHPAVIVLYFPMICIPAAALLGGHEFVWPDPFGWLVLIGVGVFAQLGQLALTRAMQTDTASRATSLSYMQIVFAALLGLLFFAEVPSAATLAGAGLILLGAALNSRMKAAT